MGAIEAGGLDLGVERSLAGRDEGRGLAVRQTHHMDLPSTGADDETVLNVPQQRGRARGGPPSHELLDSKLWDDVVPAVQTDTVSQPFELATAIATRCPSAAIASTSPVVLNVVVFTPPDNPASAEPSAAQARQTAGAGG